MLADAWRETQLSGSFELIPSRNRPITGHGLRHLFLWLKRTSGSWEVMPPTLCAITPATVTNRSSQAGQPMSTQTGRPQLSEVNTVVDFMIGPSFATVASVQVTGDATILGDGRDFAQSAHTTIASDAYTTAQRRFDASVVEPLGPSLSPGVPAPPPNVVHTPWPMPVTHH